MNHNGDETSETKISTKIIDKLRNRTNDVGIFKFIIWIR